MKVSEIMTPNEEVVSPGATLQEAAQKMRDLNVGSIPVCDGERIQGIVTDRDITIRGTADGYEPSSTSVDRVMTAGVRWCYEDDEIEAAEKLMREHQIRRILVMNRNKDLVGIVALGDIAVDANQEWKTAQTLEGISQPSEPNQ